MKYDTLIVSGGASRCIMSLGVIAKHWNDIERVRKYVGTSAGSLACLLLICGLNTDEILRLMLNVNMKYPTGGSLNWNLTGMGALLQPYLETISPYIESATNLLTKNGILEVNPYIAVAEQTVKEKFGKIPTLLELYNLTGKKLVAVGSCISTYDPVYFSYKEYPDMPCTLAIDISCRVPFLFTPIRYEGHAYVDGGLVSHFPIEQAEGRTLGIYTRGVEVGEIPDDKNISFIRFFWSLVNTSTKNKYTNLCSDDNLTLYVIKGPGGSMQVDVEDAISMYNLGFHSNPEQRFCTQETED